MRRAAILMALCLLASSCKGDTEKQLAGNFELTLRLGDGVDGSQLQFVALRIYEEGLYGCAELLATELDELPEGEHTFSVDWQSSAPAKTPFIAEGIDPVVLGIGFDVNGSPWLQGCTQTIGAIRSGGATGVIVLVPFTEEPVETPDPTPAVSMDPTAEPSPEPTPDATPDVTPTPVPEGCEECAENTRFCDEDACDGYQCDFESATCVECIDSRDDCEYGAWCNIDGNCIASPGVCTTVVRQEGSEWEEHLRVGPVIWLLSSLTTRSSDCAADEVNIQVFFSFYDDQDDVPTPEEGVALMFVMREGELISDLPESQDVIQYTPGRGVFSLDICLPEEVIGQELEVYIQDLERNHSNPICLTVAEPI